MSTQKTGIGGGKLPPKNEETVLNPEENDQGIDLGIPDNLVIDDDPTGYVPDVPVEEIAGRKVRRLSAKQLEEAHVRYAGEGVRITGERTSIPGSENQDAHTAEAPRKMVTESTMSEAERLTPAAYKGKPKQTTSAPQPTQQPPRQPVQEEPDDDDHYHPPSATSPRVMKDEAEAAAATFEYLAETERRARTVGDLASAAQAIEMSSKLQENFKVNHRSEIKMEHPALTKLLTNLGLKKIVHTQLEWGGSTWTFAPTSAQLDYWVSKSMDEEGLNIVALTISASVVGLDGIPVYEVLNIPLKKKFEVVSLDSDVVDAKKEIEIVLYKKYCTCGNQIEVDAEDCPICGSSQDKFEMPLDLRMVCAARFNLMLSEQFGAYEALPQLLRLRREAMKDRRLDAKELYPLVIPSSEEKTTQD